MQNIREIRKNVEYAEIKLEQIKSAKSKEEKVHLWKDAQRAISNARALTNMVQIRSKDQESADDKAFLRRAVLELIDGVEKDAMDIEL